MVNARLNRAIALLAFGCGTSPPEPVVDVRIPAATAAASAPSVSTPIRVEQVRMPRCGDASFLTDARLLTWCKAAFPVRQDGSLVADRAKELNALAPSKDEFDRPEPDILEIVGHWPKPSWAASRGYFLDLLEWTGARWERRGSTIGECEWRVDPEAECGPFLGFGRWTEGRVITPVWWHEERGFFVAGSAGTRGLPKLAPKTAFFPLAFRSTATGHAVLAGQSRTHNDALEIHSWAPGSLEPAIERFDDLIGEQGAVGDRPVLLTDDGATFVLAQRRAASAAPNPTDRVWRANEHPPRHDAMVILSRRDGREWKRATLAATWARNMVLTPSGALWILAGGAGKTGETSLVHMSAEGDVTTLALPPVAVDGRQTSVAWRGLLPVGETALLAIGSWGRASEEAVGLFRIDVADPEGEKPRARTAE